MKNKIVVIELDLTPKVQSKLEKIASDRDYSMEGYIAECIHSKLHDMLDVSVCVSYKIDTEE